MAFSELFKPTLKEVEDCPGVFVANGTISSMKQISKVGREINKLVRKKQRISVAEYEDESLRDEDLEEIDNQVDESFEKQAAILFKHYIRDASGQPFPDKIGSNATFDDVAPDFVTAVMGMISERIETKNKETSSTS